MALSQRVSMDMVRSLYAAQQYFMKHVALQKHDLQHMALQQYPTPSEQPQQNGSVQGDMNRDVDHFSKLPAELAVEIFSYLDIKSRLKARRVARLWNMNMTDKKIWQNFILDDFDLKNMSFKQRYRALDPIRKLRIERLKNVDIKISHGSLWDFVDSAIQQVPDLIKTLRISLAPYTRAFFCCHLHSTLDILHILEELELHGIAVDWLLYGAPQFTLPSKLKRLKLLGIHPHSQPIKWNLQGSVEELELSGGHICTFDLEPFAQTLRVLKWSNSTIDKPWFRRSPRQVPLSDFANLEELSILDTKTQALGPLPDSLKKLSLMNCHVQKDFTDGMKWLSGGQWTSFFGSCNTLIKFPVKTPSNLVVWDVVNKVLLS